MFKYTLQKGPPRLQDQYPANVYKSESLTVQATKCNACQPYMQVLAIVNCSNPGGTHMEPNYYKGKCTPNKVLEYMA